MIYKMDKVENKDLMVLISRECLWLEQSKVVDSLYGRKVLSTRETGRMINSAVKESTSGLMAKSSRVSGRKAS